MPRLTDVERPQPPDQPQRRLDPSTLALLSGVSAELAKATDDVADARSRLAGQALVNWLGGAADLYKANIRDRTKTLDATLGESLVDAKRALIELEARVQMIMAEDDQRLRAYDQLFREYSVAVQNYDAYVFGR